MNLKLFPNEVKVDFIVGNKELFRVPDEIKQISFNKSGSLVGISTKLNKFYLYDYFGHNLIASILYFHENKYIIKSFCFNEKNNLYIAYEYSIQEEDINSGIKEINLEKEFKNIIHININNKDEYIIPISDDEKSEHQIFNEVTNAKIIEIQIENEKLLISGNNPYIYDLNSKERFYLIKPDYISLLPNSNIKKQKDVEIFIDNNEKNMKNKGKKEEKGEIEEQNNEETNKNNNNHFIIFNNNIDSDSFGQNNSIADNKNDIDSINKNNKKKENPESNNNNIKNSFKNNNVVQSGGEIKEVDINIDNTSIQNNDNNNSENNINVNNVNPNNNNNIADEINSKNNIEIKISEKKYNPNSIFIRFGYNSTTFYLIVKELYIFLILHLKKQKPENTSEENDKDKDMIIEENIYPSLDELTKSIHSFKKMRFFDFIKEGLNDQLYVSRIYDSNGEIIHVELNTRNNLILINSNDRIVRLFEIINDSIILQKEYCDSVNKRKYTNCYFYTYKLKSGIQDLILMALNDSNGLEFCFIDIVTGNIIKKLETLKYSISDFICHYQNHFSILIFSGKKIFCISGAMVNQLDCLAPGLKYLEENVEYIEEESFYDNFDEKMKKQIQMQNNHEEKIEDIFSKRKKKEENIFIKIDYDNEIKNNDSIEREKSINELKELFAYVGQQIQ